MLAQAAVTVVGWCKTTSSAWLGPESTTISSTHSAGRFSAKISEIRFNVSGSIPSKHEQIVLFIELCYHFSHTSRIALVGTATTIVSE